MFTHCLFCCCFRPGQLQPRRQEAVRRPAEQLQPPHPARPQQHAEADRQAGAQALPADRRQPQGPSHDHQRLGRAGRLSTHYVLFRTFFSSLSSFTWFQNLRRLLANIFGVILRQKFPI